MFVSILFKIKCSIRRNTLISTGKLSRVNSNSHRSKSSKNKKTDGDEEDIYTFISTIRLWL